MHRADWRKPLAIFLGMLCVVAVPVMLLRLFGFLFFYGTLPFWAVVPALVLGAFPFVMGAQSPARQCGALALVGSYLLSAHYFVIPNFDAQREADFEIVEAVIILAFSVISFLPSAKVRSNWHGEGHSSPQPQTGKQMA